jgi:hypothetical protein
VKHYHLITCLLIALIPATAADTFNYVNWTSSTSSSVTGTIGSTTVTYSSTDLSFAQLSGNSPWGGYLPASTWMSSLVGNPPPNAQIIGIQGTSATHTITFSQPVSNVIMDLVSLGAPGNGTQYAFTSPFTILNIGPSNQYGGGTNTLQQSGNTLTGNEGDGIILFAGPLTSITWTGANPEFWNGFTIAVDSTQTPLPTPLPSTAMLMLLGLAAVGGIFYFISRRQASFS